MKTTVHKGVIVAAGYGTRFLPATKTLPKEMLPLLDKPAIHFIVEEFVASGIDEILIITSRRKKVLDDYFDREVELESILSADKKDEGKLATLKSADFDGVRFSFVRQKEMKGTVDALYLTRDFAGEDPFVVAYPDDIFFSRTPVTKQLIKAFETTASDKPIACAVAVEDYGEDDVSRYGVAVPVRKSELDNKVMRFRSIVEKPEPPEYEEPPSHSVTYGRYVFSSALFPALEAELRRQEREGIKEITQSNAISRLHPKNTLLAVHYEGVRRDLGQPDGCLAAMLEYALIKDGLDRATQEQVVADTREILSRWEQRQPGTKRD